MMRRHLLRLNFRDATAGRVVGPGGSYGALKPPACRRGSSPIFFSCHFARRWYAGGIGLLEG